MWVYRNLCAVMVLVIFGFSVSAAIAAPLRYHPPKDQTFAYEVEIVGDLPNEVETCKGIISYKILDTGEIVKMTYEGGLGKSTKMKPGTRSEPGFPPMMPFPRGPMGPFGSSYRGLISTTNKLSCTSRGKIVTMEGDSQLPFLLGNLSLMPFELLPQDEQMSWTNDDGAAITEGSSTPWGRPFFFGHGGNEKRTAASEVTSFNMQGRQGDLISFRKTYKLSASNDEEKIDINGEGTWVFNQKDGMPESLDFKYTLVTNESNVTLNIPVTVKYTRLSDAQLAQYVKEREEKRQEAQRKFEEEQARRKVPLDEQELAKLLRDLRSGNSDRQRKALQTLLDKEDIPDNSELSKAVQMLLKHRDNWVHDDAERAMSKISPEFKRKNELTEAYDSFMPLEVGEVGAPIRANTKLPTGLRVAVQNMHSWKAATVLRSAGKGKFEVEMAQFTEKKVVDWPQIRLAPAEVDQPFVDKKVLAKLYPENTDTDDDVATDRVDSEDEDSEGDVFESDDSYRTWTDDTGTFKIVAKYIDTKDSTVYLERKKDGKEVKVPLDRLSEEDQEVVKRLQEKPKATNPFE